MNKKISILPLLLTLYCSSFSKKESVTAIKYVFAKSGLILRKKPELNSEPIVTIPYGNRVIVSLDEPLGKEIEIENLNGNYRLIKYSDNTGFVFDGFLSTLIPPNAKSNDISDYFEKNFKKVKGPIYRPANINESETKVYEIYYENGIISSTTIYLGGGYTTISIPNGTINDGKLLLLAIYPKLKKLKFNKEKDSESFTIRLQDDVTSIEEYYNIRLTDSILIITVGGQT
ncbi:SH3 domain-containing protein [Leptospira kmetyi]|uniref:SH3 domain-containing protein n=1 Tax=Leptospira kmetyi TaxID=408139 RepID=UPI003EBEE79F